MTELMRVKTRWSGFNGGPGYTVMHFRDFGSGDGGGGAVDSAGAAAAVERVHAFFNSIKQGFPEAVRLDVEGEVDVLEDTTGELVNSLGVAQPATISGTGVGAYSAASGAVINWRTGGIRRGRKIRGRSFLVPLSGNNYDGQGQLNSNFRTLVQDRANILAISEGSPDLGVYARPSGPGATDGTWSVVTSANVPAMLAVLRSRRD